LQFAIRDTGVGIAEKDVKAIFQPFSQVGSTQLRPGGTGLGLAISRQFVRLMGSDLEVESRVGQGSVFRFTLEVEVVNEPLAAASADRITGYAGCRRRVLVVDDLEENRAVVRDMLGQLGFEVCEAADGLEALERIQSLRPDLILMDMVMPNVDGLEAIRRLRQRPDSAELPVITVSASASSCDEESALAAGANAFLPKPIHEPTLIAQIGSLLSIDWIRESPDALPARA
jgi:CheY-like chemotaxis protein